MAKYSKLAINDPQDLLFGVSPKPLKTRQGLTIGGGAVYPELNFTLPPMIIEESTIPNIYAQYRQIITDATRRAAELETPGLVVEFELLPPMTEVPQWGIDITRILVDGIEDAHAKWGLKSVLRVTPTDIRHGGKPPLMRSGQFWDNMLKTFEGAGAAGAELLSIESVGGKEVHDDALTMGDIGGVIFSLCVMGARDMKFLWDHIDTIARRHGVHSAGDTACGFGNTAMVLAEQHMIPRVFAAVVRSVTAVRSLVAYECGAVGPGKDCGYENPFLKVITGLPMAMEGKTAACAHLSPLGNIASATADTWSNESVQNIRLLGAMAPTSYLEQLIYDCRLMNRALADGHSSALLLQKWLVESDASLDPQAYILTPENTIRIARAIVTAPDYYRAGKAAALETVNLLCEGQAAGRVRIADREKSWLPMLQATLEEMPDSEEQFIGQQMAQVDREKFVAADYLL